MRVETCPDPIRLREIIDNTLPTDEQADIIAHLDDCPCCQAKLEHLAVGDSAFLLQVSHAKVESPEATSAFWPALNEVQDSLQTRPAPADDDESTFDEEEELDLDFLAPSESPEYLGRLGTYEIMEVIGRGGMGIVLRAFDPCLQRQVAVKVLAPRFAKNELARKRFCRESRAAARVTHENVVAVHLVDEEESGNVPFLVMQLVEGESLQERLDRDGALPLRTILRFGQQIAAGLAAAHEKGLVHRDIKPANILIERGLDRIKLTDFGLARAEEDARLTQSGFVAGTPLYMAPEQAKGDPIDQRSDLFSFGSVLYAMCTGKPPFAGTTPFVILKNLTEATPAPITTINPNVPDWLVRIIAKLQAKRPDDRYQSATEVARLFEEALATLQPTNPHMLAPQPACEGVRRFAKIGVMAWASAGLLAAGLFLSEMTGMTRMVAPLFQGSELQPTRVLEANAGSVWSVAFTPDGNTVAAAIENGTVRLWDVSTGEVRGTLEVHRPSIIVLAMSPDGHSFATGSDDGLAKIWDLQTREPIHTLKHPFGVRALAFSPDGKRLITGDRDGGVRIWDAEKGERITETKGHNGMVTAVAVSADGRLIASSSMDQTIKLWDARSGLALQTLSGHTGAVLSVVFSPDSKQVVSGGWDKTVRVWEIASGQAKRVLEGHTQDVWAVGVCPGGVHIVSGSDDQTVRIWSLATGEPLKTVHAHDRAVYSVAFARQRLMAASAGRDGTVKLWAIDQ